MGNWYGDYLASDHWRQTRLEALRHSRFRCHECGATGRLEVHHKNYDNLYWETLADLEVLCRECHQARHVTPDQREQILLDWLQGRP